jgi:hypothetical protein
MMQERHPDPCKKQFKENKEIIPIKTGFLDSPNILPLPIGQTPPPPKKKKTKKRKKKGRGEQNGAGKPIQFPHSDRGC